jgi:hypothetical protein
LEFWVDIVLETFSYIDYYKVKSFDWLMNEDVDFFLNNLDDYFEIVEHITSVLFNSFRYTTVVLKISSFSILLIYKVITIKEKSLVIEHAIFSFFPSFYYVVCNITFLLRHFHLFHSLVIDNKI